ncbi:MAG: amidohydrolase [Desulfuromonadales bacterium]|nr:amidohydrolase [Desulfuromonadales bacterium]
MNKMQKLSVQVNALAKELANTLAAFRRDLHRHPELSFQEKRTSQAIRNLLSQSGIDFIPLEAETGVLGVIEGHATLDSSLVTALRGDIDALPIKEMTGLEYSSVHPQVMHACGHDGNTTMVLGAAIILSRLRASFGGVVKLIFQPGEETLRGAKSMIAQGVLDNPRVDRIYACHGWPGLTTGQIGVYPGRYMASAGRFEISVTSSGSHGAYPHQASDATLTACEIVQRLNCVVSRELSALDSAVLSVCTINGGEAFNIMPEKVIITGTIRCLNKDVEACLKAAIERVVEGVTKTNRCGGNLIIEDLVPSLCNSTSGVEAVQLAASRIMPSEAFALLPQPCMGSEDFSHYLQKVPEGAFIRVGVTPEGQHPIPLHSGKFNFDDQSLVTGSALLAQIVLDRHVP